MERKRGLRSFVELLCNIVPLTTFFLQFLTIGDYISAWFKKLKKTLNMKDLKGGVFCYPKTSQMANTLSNKISDYCIEQVCRNIYMSVTHTKQMDDI